ncbi:MAG: hypothetical protein NW241_16415 [Bacteroidia bacterium]|nr:hypothetical protein [Bacteroidia bacterium]
MKTRYWLEAWSGESRYRQVCNLLGSKPAAQARAAVEAGHFSEALEPGAHRINELLDLAEHKRERLDRLDLPSGALSVWVECAYSDAHCTLNLDAATLQRFGELGIRLCVTAWRGSGDGLPCSEELPETRPVQVVKVQMQAADQDPVLPEAALADLRVWLDDGSIWGASAATPLYSARMFRKAPFFFHPHLILIARMEQQLAERMVVDLLASRRLEEAFYPVYLPDTREQHELVLTSELSFLHEDYLPISLRETLGLRDEQLIQGRHLTRVRETHALSNPFDTRIPHLLNMLRGRYPQLAALGVQRQDISIACTYQHQLTCRLDYTPELLGAVGNSGHFLSLVSRQVPELIVRTSA